MPACSSGFRRHNSSSATGDDYGYVGNRRRSMAGGCRRRLEMGVTRTRRDLRIGAERCAPCSRARGHCLPWSRCLAPRLWRQRKAPSHRCPPPITRHVTYARRPPPGTPAAWRSNWWRRRRRRAPIPIRWGSRAAGRSWPPAKASEGAFGLRPQDLHSIYALPTTVASTQTIAIVDAYKTHDRIRSQNLR